MGTRLHLFSLMWGKKQVCRLSGSGSDNEALFYRDWTDCIPVGYRVDLCVCTCTLCAGGDAPVVVHGRNLRTS